MYTQQQSINSQNLSIFVLMFRVANNSYSEIDSKIPFIHSPRIVCFFEVLARTDSVGTNRHYRSLKGAVPVRWEQIYCGEINCAAIMNYKLTYRILVGTVLSRGRGQIKCQVIIWRVSKIYFIASICFKIRLSITIIVNVIFVIMQTSQKRVLNYRRWKLVLSSGKSINKPLRFGKIAALWM